MFISISIIRNRWTFYYKYSSVTLLYLHLGNQINSLDINLFIFKGADEFIDNVYVLLWISNGVVWSFRILDEVFMFLKVLVGIYQSVHHLLIIVFFFFFSFWLILMSPENMRLKCAMYVYLDYDVEEITTTTKDKDCLI